jgi:hypothetical protein
VTLPLKNRDTGVPVFQVSHERKHSKIRISLYLLFSAFSIPPTIKTMGKGPGANTPPNMYVWGAHCHGSSNTTHHTQTLAKIRNSNISHTALITDKDTLDSHDLEQFPKLKIAVMVFQVVRSFPTCLMETLLYNQIQTFHIHVSFDRGPNEFSQWQGNRQIHTVFVPQPFLHFNYYICPIATPLLSPGSFPDSICPLNGVWTLQWEQGFSNVNGTMSSHCLKIFSDIALSDSLTVRIVYEILCLLMHILFSSLHCKASVWLHLTCSKHNRW